MIQHKVPTHGKNNIIKYMATGNYFLNNRIGGLMVSVHFRCGRSMV
jgi:hypothetical protein